MPSSFRHRRSYRWLVAVLAADVLALASLLLNQWLEADPWFVWALAAVLAASTLPWLVLLADAVFSAAGRGPAVPLAGEKNP